MLAESLTAPKSGFRVKTLAPHWPILLGAALLTIPTLISVANVSWSTESGAHGPIVIATGAWLVANSTAAFRASRPGRPLLPAIFFALSLLAYGIGRMTTLVLIEMTALYAVYVSGAVVMFGAGWIRKLWFPLIYFLFALPIPDNVIYGATQPLKVAISQYAVKLLSAFGYTVGRAGVTLQVDQYQLLVATACTGVHSMIGITAISIFYVYVRYAQNWRLALLLISCVIPIGMLLNFLRVIFLILQTHYLGEASAQGYTHDLSGFLMFALAIGLLFAIEEPMSLLARRLGWREDAAIAAAATAAPVVDARETPRAGRAGRFAGAPASRRELLVGGTMAAAAAAIWWRMPRRRIGLPEAVSIEHIIPQTLNGWKAAPGGSFVLPEADAVREAAIYQDMLTRSYVRGGTDIMLLIAYAETQTHMLHIHRPEQCYPAAGFTITQPEPVSIDVGAAHPFTGAFMTASTLGRTEHVLYWLRIGSEFPVTFAQQHLSIARQNLSGAVPDGALVRLSIADSDAGSARAELLHFAKSLAAGVGTQGRTLLLGPAIAAELGARDPGSKQRPLQS